METLLTIASRREVRGYDGRPLPDEVARRILDSGRLAGSARNQQPWRFVVVESVEARERLAGAVYVPTNVSTAGLVVGVVVPTSGLETPMDAGRCMQNMLLAAWDQGVGSCPNGFPDRPAAARILGVREGEDVLIVLTFGYPTREAAPQRRSPDEWSGRAARKSLDELVTRI